MIRFVLIEPCNFVNFPIGGQLSFARQLMQAFGNELALVGYAHKNEPAGKWIKKNIDGIVYDYFGIRYIANTDSKPLIPLRIQNLFWFYFHIKKILKYNNAFWFIQAPEILMIASRYKSKGMTYMFPGVTNPLEIPRYKWGLMFASSFYNDFLKSLRKTDLLLACADNNAINGLRQRAGKHLSDLDITHFPTRYDSKIFFPIPVNSARSKLGIPQDINVIVCCGRINEVKGWQLSLDSYREYHKNDKSSLLIFVGDGEDKPDLIRQINQYQLQENVLVTGFQTVENVALYLNSCNVSIVGSIREGWSISMLEALGCGKAIVSTAVSGANTLIKQGENGFVVDSRDPEAFAEKIRLSLLLDKSYETSLSVAKQYSISSLKVDLLSIWKEIDS